jgi:hypothetical protein
MESPGEVSAVPVFADQHDDAFVTMDMNQGQEPSMPEYEEDRLALFPELQHVAVPGSFDAQGAEESLQRKSGKGGLHGL